MANPETTVLIAGATGMVGGYALGRLEGRAGVERIVPVGRRAPAATGPHITPQIVDFAALPSTAPIPARTALCALGTTLKKAGSEEAFIAVDFKAVTAFARWAKAGGVKVFGLVSSLGADARASSLYMRVKGEAEDTIAALGFPTFIALRPGLLLGDRAESRPAESFGQAIMPLFNPLLFGGARRYRAIDAATVGAALASLAVTPPPAGRAVWQYDEIMAAAAT